MGPSCIRTRNQLTAKALERGKKVLVRCYSSLKVWREVFLTNDFFGFSDNSYDLSEICQLKSVED